MFETQASRTHSFDSTVDDSKYDVVARLEGAIRSEDGFINTDYERLSKFADLSVAHLHHVLEGRDFEDASSFGLAFKLKKYERISTRATSTALAGKFELLQKWAGHVIAIEDDEFTAVIKDKTNPDNPDEEVVIALDELSPSDQRALTVGSEIFWTIGYETNRSGSKSRKSEIRLRRLAPFCQEEFDLAKEKTLEMKNLFGVNDFG
ncbi:hypothetical protein [Marinobacter sp. MBR-105]|jgi:hypothetical protein